MRGTHNFRDPEELARVTTIAKHSTARELQRLFRRDGSQHFARALGIPFKAGELPQCYEIEEHFTRLRENEPDEHEPGVCNCQIPEGLRWGKVDEGLPVLWYLDVELKDQHMVSEFLSCINYAYGEWTKACDIKFEQASSIDAADTVWRYQPLEDENTLEITYMPRSGDEMDIRDKLSGDVVWNSNVDWDPVKKRAVSLHGVGHSIGISHVEDRDSIMFWQWHGQTELTSHDKNAALIKYPYDDTPAAA